MIDKLGMFLMKYGPKAESLAGKGLGKGKMALEDILAAIKDAPKASTISGLGGAAGGAGLASMMGGNDGDGMDDESSEGELEQYLEMLKKKKSMMG